MYSQILHEEINLISKYCDHVIMCSFEKPRLTGNTLKILHYTLFKDDNLLNLWIQVHHCLASILFCFLRQIVTNYHMCCCIKCVNVKMTNCIFRVWTFLDYLTVSCSKSGRTFCLTLILPRVSIWLSVLCYQTTTSM